MHPFGEAQEVLIAFGGWAGRKAFDLGRHSLSIFVKVKKGAILIETTPLRVEPDKVQVVAATSTCLRKDAMQDARHGKDGRSHIEAEAIFG